MSLKSKLKVAIRFLLINLVFLLLTSPLVVLYGPFHNVKNAVVGAVATSMHSDFLKYFMSEDEINKILAGSQITSDSISQKINKFKNAHDQSVRLTEINGTRFKGYLLEISDPTRLKVGVSGSLGENGQTTSQIAKENGAIAAINAGGFDDPNGTGTGRLPIGIVIHNGYFVEGENTKGPIGLVGLNDKGALIAGTYTINEIKKMNIKEGISFGPPLIVNGKKMITSGDGGWGIAPRTAIGQRADGTLLLLVIDGRQPQYSIGATLLDVQNVLYENGAYIAVNLDGGSSATMYYNGKVINRPADLLGERSIPTAFVVK